MPSRTALFAGTFDPVTLGHLDLVRRAAPLFDALIIAVARSGKPTLFTADERVAFVAENVRSIANVRVVAFDGLLVDVARREGASVLLRGVRTIEDWEYELRMMEMNRHLAPSLDTLFLAPSAAYAFVASSLVREVSALGGSVEGLVPPNVARALKAKPTPPNR
jgi:pantetheine-phosphate adenylyltransferase